MKDPFFVSLLQRRTKKVSKGGAAKEWLSRYKAKTGEGEKDRKKRVWSKNMTIWRYRETYEKNLKRTK
jgi:hypothetical protein